MLTESSFMLCGLKFKHVYYRFIECYCCCSSCNCVLACRDWYWRKLRVIVWIILKFTGSYHRGPIWLQLLVWHLFTTLCCKSQCWKCSHSPCMYRTQRRWIFFCCRERSKNCIIIVVAYEVGHKVISFMVRESWEISFVRLSVNPGYF